MQHTVTDTAHMLVLLDNFSQLGESKVRHKQEVISFHHKNRPSCSNSVIIWAASNVSLTYPGDRDNLMDFPDCSVI